MKQQVKSDTFQEEDDQQAEEEQQAATTILEPVELEVIPESGNTQYHQRIMKCQMMMMTMTMTK